MEDNTKTGLSVGVVLIAVLVLCLVWGSFVVVSPGERGVVVQLGTVKGVMNSGFNFKIPFIQSVEKINVQKQKEQVDATAASQDLQNVTATVAVNYIVSPDKVDLLYKNLGENFKTNVIDPAIQEAIKASTANYTAEQLVTRREDARQSIEDLLKEKLSPNYIDVKEVSIVNFKFSDQFEQAIESKVTAVQNAEAAKNKLVQIQYEAQQRVAEADGEAKAISIQAQAIQQQGGSAYIQLKAIEKWNGQYPQTYFAGSAATPLINIGK